MAWPLPHAMPRPSLAPDAASAGWAVKAQTAARLAWSVWAATLALLAGTLTLAAANQGSLPRLTDELGLALAFLCFATVGALIASRRRGNAVGWICCVIGLTASLSVAPVEYAKYALAHPGSLPAASTLLWPAMWAWYPTLGLMTTFLLLLFPTGHLPSRRWRPVAWAAGTTIVGTCLAAAVAPGPPDTGLPSSPLGIQQMAPAWELIEPIGLLLLGPLTLASAASLVVRFRRASGEERQQLKWFTYGAAGLVLVVTVSAAVPTVDDWIPNLVAAATLAAIPLAIGVAILRYRLYDIDRLINRTLVYGLLTAVLGFGYAGAVLVLGQRRDQRPAELGRRRRHPGRGCGVPARPSPHPERGGPALQPSPLRRRPDHRGLQRPPPRRGRLGHSLGRAARRDRPYGAAHQCIAVAATTGGARPAPVGR